MFVRPLSVLLGLVLTGAAVFGVVRMIATRSAPERSALRERTPAERSGTVLSDENPSSLLVCPTSWPGSEDTDGDELPNTVEAIYHTNDAVADTDGDGFTDGDEVRNGYDPTRPGDIRLDSDEDGLLEHDECTWKTDPFVPDTDGDGFTDGDEVRNEFDPTIAGDGHGSDALPSRRAQLAEEALRPNPDSTNFTEGLTAILLGDQPVSEGANIPVTPARVEELLSTVRLDTALPDVAISELAIQETNTVADIETYLRTMDTIRPSALTESTTLTNAVSGAVNGRPQDLAEIRLRLAQYEAELLRVPTPASAVQHQTLLIALTRFFDSRLAVVEATATSDPARTYIAIRELQEGLAARLPQLQSLRANLEALAAGQSTSF